MFFSCFFFHNSNTIKIYNILIMTRVITLKKEQKKKKNYEKTLNITVNTTNIDCRDTETS